MHRREKTSPDAIARTEPTSRYEAPNTSRHLAATLGNRRWVKKRIHKMKNLIKTDPKKPRCGPAGCQGARRNDKGSERNRKTRIRTDRSEGEQTTNQRMLTKGINRTRLPHAKAASGNANGQQNQHQKTQSEHRQNKKVHNERLCVHSMVVCSISTCL